jgi:hypothetical protein
VINVLVLDVTRLVKLSNLAIYSNNAFRSNWGSWYDGVVLAGLMEEVFDRYDVFAGACDIVPQLPQSNKFLN